MNIRFVINHVMDYIYNRKINFILTVIILGITVYLTAFVEQLYCESEYNMYAVKNALNSNNLINVKVVIDTQDPEINNKIKEMDQLLKESYQEDYGKFWSIEGRYVNGNSSELIKTLYVDDSISDLCKTGYRVSEKHEGYITAYIGCKLKDKYPIGTIITEEYTGSKLYIAGYLNKGDSWIPDLLFHNNEALVNLDEYIIAEMDDSYFAISDIFYMSMSNSLYVQCASAKEVEQETENIRSMASAKGINCYVDSLEQLIKDEKRENKDLTKSIGKLVIFVMILGMLAYLSSAFSDINSRQYEIAVMYVNNMTPADMFVMLLIENLIKLMISMGAALYLRVRSIESVSAMLVFKDMVVPLILVQFAVFMICVTVLSYQTVKSKKTILFLQGGRL